MKIILEQMNDKKIKIPRCKNGKQHDFGYKDLQICRYCHLIYDDRFNHYDKSKYLLTDERIQKEIKNHKNKIKNLKFELELNHKQKTKII